MKKCAGLAQIPLMLGLLLMAVAIPVVSQLTKNSQETRNRAQSMPITYYRLIGDQCVVAGIFLTIDECQQVVNGTCYENSNCESGGEDEPTATPDPISRYYICDSKPGMKRLCSISYSSESACQAAIIDSNTQKCVNDCNKECLNTYSVCIDPAILEKCPNGSRTMGCEQLLYSNEVPMGEIAGINYFYADPPNNFLARCFSFDYDFEASQGRGGVFGELECYERFGKQNCFISNGDCSNVCPKPSTNTITPAPPFEAYRCMESTCQRQIYASIDECLKENGFAGCFNGCSDQFCSVEQELTEYYYCDYNSENVIEGSSFVTGECGHNSFKNIYECYSQHEKCTLLNCDDNPLGMNDNCQKSVIEEDKKLKLYFCSPSGCRWEMFKNWVECGKLHGVCYDALNQCKLYQRCAVAPPTDDIYYLDMSYTKYSEQCRKSSYKYLEDCELYVNGCEEGTTLDYCKRQLGENFENARCFMNDSLCGRPAQEPLTIEVTPKFSSNPVRAKEEFSLEIFADVINDGQTMPDFSIKVCMTDNLTRVLDKDNTSDCSFTVEDVEDETQKCYQISGSCVAKSEKTVLARLWFVSEAANTTVTFSVDWPGYFADELILNIGNEARSCDTGENGDANKNGEITMDDHGIWENEYFIGTSMTSDFNCDSKIDLLDFEIWRSGYFNRNISITPSPKPVECTNGEWKCLDATRAQQCVEGFWKNTICGSGYKCDTGVCKEVQCIFENEKYSIGTSICTDTYLPSVCRSNGLFEEGEWCNRGDWCKDGICKEITCTKGDQEYKVGESYCGVQSIFKCGGSGSFYSYACNGTLVPGERSCQCVPFENSPTPTPPVGTPVTKCYRRDNYAEMNVGDTYCQDDIFYLCQSNGILYEHQCINGCLGDECASEI